MEVKKTRAADIYKKTALYRSIGLMISLTLMISAFQWKSYDEAKVDLKTKNTNTFELIVEIPPTEQPPPPAPQVLSTQVIEVPDEQEIKEEIKVNLDIEVTDQTKVEQITVVMQAPDPPEEETEKIFTVVEETASPKGGMATFYQFVKDNIQYPPQAKRMGIQGRVYVEFVIAKDGSLTDVHVVKGIGAGCDEEAVRIVQSAPSWNPGRQRGKPVRQRYTLPIIFKMANL